jgi:DNA-binding NarL/FixJ family response regulator
MKGIEERQYHDRLKAVRTLTAQGLSAADVATQLGLNPRTVVRYRARLRQVAA